MSAIVVAGSLNADLMVRTERRPDGGETVRGSDLMLGAGGKSANQAIAAARVGARVRMLGAVGDDVFGVRLRSAIDVEGIDHEGVATVPGRASGTAIIVVDDAGENSIVVSPGANARVDADFIDRRRAAFDGASAVLLCLEIPLDGVLAAARAGRDAGATVITNLSPMREVPAELLASTDLLLVNEHELAGMVGSGLSWDGCLGELAKRGVERAVVTLGGRGSVVLDAATGVTVIDPVSVDVVDTTGCGDAFTGTVGAALDRGLSLVDAARVGSRVSADAATRAGASASYARADVAARLAWGT